MTSILFLRYYKNVIKTKPILFLFIFACHFLFHSDFIDFVFLILIIIKINLDKKSNNFVFICFFLIDYTIRNETDHFSFISSFNL